MRNAIGLITIFAISVLLWGSLIGRVVAMTTAKLGPVSINWTNLSRPQAYFGWRPVLNVYKFSKPSAFTRTQSILLGSGEKATFYIKLPAKFNQGKVNIRANGLVNITTAAEGQVINDGTEINWLDLKKTSGVYEIVITNADLKTVVINKISITLIP